MIKILAILIMPAVALAQEHGHTHGSGGENEHMYPVLAILAALALAGVISHFVSKKK